MKNKTIELAAGVNVTLAPADGWAILKRQTISERLEEFADGSETLGNYVWYFSMCAAQVVSVKGLDWEPPELWAAPEALRANFEAWMKVLPTPQDNITLWLNTISELNSPAVAEELAPGGTPKPGDPKVKKSSKDD